MTPPTAAAPAAPASAAAPLAPVRTPGGRVYNCNAGPSILPEEVIRQIQNDIWDFRGTGYGILEHSHRAKPFDDLLAETFDAVRRAGEVPKNFHILFMTGGSSSQNWLVPANLLPAADASDGAARRADYIETDYWSTRSIQDAKQYGAPVHVAYSGLQDKFASIPAPDQLQFSPAPAYVHFTSNNTIYGTQWPTEPPAPAGTPLVCDMCSDIFSRPIDWARYGLVYASAQKNLGTTGATVVFVRDDLVQSGRRDIPRMAQYRTYVTEESRPNTPPHFAIYTVGLMANWIIRQGGLAAMARRNAEKAAAVYSALDSTPFYRPHARADSRSLMNITFRLPSEALEEKFLKDALAHGLDGMRGHRATGGIRISIYNAFPTEGCHAIAAFLREFARTNG